MMRFAACLALILCVSAPARAQVNVGPGTGGPGGYGAGNPTGNSGFTPAGVPGRGPEQDDDRAPPKEDKPVAPPPAIPGAVPDENAAVAPADKIAAEMSPNEALFDAITRGDVAAAKDALNRGAQLDARNVLGQTPTDASIDLDRNDITFLLLSMRGASGSGAPPARVASAAPTHGKGPHKPVISASAPQLSADRGTPNPAVGFIGF